MRLQWKQYPDFDGRKSARSSFSGGYEIEPIEGGSKLHASMSLDLAAPDKETMLHMFKDADQISMADSASGKDWLNMTSMTTRVVPDGMEFHWRSVTTVTFSTVEMAMTVAQIEEDRRESAAGMRPKPL